MKEQEHNKASQALSEALVAHKKEKDVTQEQMASPLRIGISYKAYSTIESGERKLKKVATLSAMARYFQRVGDYAVTKALLTYSGFNVKELQKTFELAAWHRLPELPPKAAGRGASDTVAVTYIHTFALDKPFRTTSQGRYDHRLKEWQGEFPHWANIDGWKVLVIPDWPLLPEAEAIQGVKDE